MENLETHDSQPVVAESLLTRHRVGTDYRNGLARSSDTMQETISDQIPFSVREWVLTPPAVQGYLLGLIARERPLKPELADLLEQVKESYDVEADVCRHCWHAVNGRDPALIQQLRQGVSVVIPARNEEPTIGEVIQGALPYCEEIVVVDGHSADRTVEVAESFGVRVVTDNGVGKGDAIRVGAAAAGGEIIVYMDADGSHDSADIPRLVEPIKQGRADLVVGSRGKGGSDELHGDIEKLLRLVGADLILIGINLRWKTNLTDSQNGFRAIRTEVVRSLGLRENITTIEQEMTMKCLKQGYVVAEVPTHEYARQAGESVIKLKKVWFRYVYSFLRYLT